MFGNEVGGTVGGVHVPGARAASPSSGVYPQWRVVKVAIVGEEAGSFEVATRGRQVKYRWREMLVNTKR